MRTLLVFVLTLSLCQVVAAQQDIPPRRDTPRSESLTRREQLELADQTLGIALRALGQDPDRFSGSRVESSLLDKAQLVARRLIELCRVTDCTRGDDEDDQN